MTHKTLIKFLVWGFIWIIVSIPTFGFGIACINWAFRKIPNRDELNTFAIDFVNVSVFITGIVIICGVILGGIFHLSYVGKGWELKKGEIDHDTENA